MLSDNAKTKIDESMKKYPVRQSAVMDALFIAQAESDTNSVTTDDMAEIANLLDMMPIEVHQVASFYTMYNLEKSVGKYHIQVCRNISCSLLDAEKVIAQIEDLLKIKVGETTGDKKYTLTTVECLGSCGTAPMMQINNKYYEDLTSDKVEQILLRDLT